MEPTEPSDAELIARHVAGDQEAFGLLVARHRDRLWAVALRTLGDREEAADALQDALVSAFRSAHTFQGRAAVTTWLHRIVVNACLDRARRSSTRRTRPLDEAPRSAVEQAVGTGEAADVAVELLETRRELSALLGELPADQRAALVLVDMEGYSVAEAAEILKVPVGTVKSRCARGRAKLLPHLRHLRPQPQSQAPQAAEAPDPAPGVSRETARNLIPRPNVTAMSEEGGGQPA